MRLYEQGDFAQITNSVWTAWCENAGNSTIDRYGSKHARIKEERKSVPITLAPIPPRDPRNYT